MVLDKLKAMVPAKTEPAVESAGASIARSQAEQLRKRAAEVRADGKAADWQLARAAADERKADELDKLAGEIKSAAETGTTPPAADAARAADLALLSMVAAGTHPNMLEPELADEIEAVLTRWPDDAAMQAEGEKAINAYSNGLMSATG